MIILTFLFASTDYLSKIYTFLFADARQPSQIFETILVITPSG